jgi:hypothetical protein
MGKKSTPVPLTGFTLHGLKPGAEQYGCAVQTKGTGVEFFP